MRNSIRAISAIARADFLERVRRYSFLLTLLFATLLGYAAATGRITIQLGGYRGVYTSAWMGALVAITTTCFVSLVGFYIVKNAIDRDRQTRVGQILAATPLSKSAYTLGKFVSNVAVLASMVVVLAIAGVLMQLFAGEDPHLDGVALLSPFLIVALPAMVLTAALAVLFETLPILRGGAGNVAWFFVWVMSIALPEITGRHWLDPMGVVTVSDSMMAGARAHIPGYKGDFAFTIVDKADKPAQIVQSFHWQGVPWNASQLILRLGWVGVAILLVLLAALLFDRFDSSRWFAPPVRRPKQPAVSSDEDVSAVAPLGGAVAGRSGAHLTPLSNSAPTNAFGRLFLAELRLAVKGLRWWWYAVVVGLLVAQFAAPLEVARGPILGTAWMWLVLVWSAMGARESRFGTEALLFSSAHILPRQLPACWLAGVAIAAIVGIGAGSRLLLAQGWPGLVPWLAGALFLPSLALALGVWSGTGKPFEGLLTALWYVGPMNHSRGIDFTGTGSGAQANHYALIYFGLSAVLVAAAVFGRARQLRAN
ncbi:MAG: hypothetical protein ABSH13_17130 [Candidatus Acidiferrum sp.]